MKGTHIRGNIDLMLSQLFKIALPSTRLAKLTIKREQPFEADQITSLCKLSFPVNPSRQMWRHFRHKNGGISRRLSISGTVLREECAAIHAKQLLI